MVIRFAMAAHVLSLPARGEPGKRSEIRNRPDNSLLRLHRIDSVAMDNRLAVRVEREWNSLLHQHADLNLGVLAPGEAPELLKGEEHGWRRGSRRARSRMRSTSLPTHTGHECSSRYLFRGSRA